MEGMEELVAVAAAAEVVGLVVVVMVALAVVVAERSSLHRSMGALANLVAVVVVVLWLVHHKSEVMAVLAAAVVVQMVTLRQLSVLREWVEGSQPRLLLLVVVAAAFHSVRPSLSMMGGSVRFKQTEAPLLLQLLLKLLGVWRNLQASFLPTHQDKDLWEPRPEMLFKKFSCLAAIQ
jgi:hypothetical protein